MYVLCFFIHVFRIHQILYNKNLDVVYDGITYCNTFNCAGELKYIFLTERVVVKTGGGGGGASD